MKSLINFNNKILKEYSDWEEANQDNWNIVSYLNQFYDLNAALAFSKLYFPDFVEEKGCVILGFRYNKDVFDQWYNHFNGQISPVERYCNLYDVADYFHINSSGYESEELYEKSIVAFSEVLKKSWELNLKLLYPAKQFIVEQVEEFGTKKITFYSAEES